MKDDEDVYRLCVYDYIGTLPAGGALEILQPQMHTHDLVEWIYSGALRDLPGLQSLVIPESVIRILDHALMNCPQLSSISFPENLIRIDANAFTNTGNNGQYVLRITNPQQFWSTSKYLVIQVK